MAIIIGNIGNMGTFRFMDICSQVPHERALVLGTTWNSKSLILSRLQNMFPDSRSSHAKQLIEK